MKLFLWLTKAWVLALIGVSAIALIIWFEGPLVAFRGEAPLETAASRWTLILALYGLCIAYFLLKWLFTRLAAAKLARGIAAAGEGAGAEATAAGASPADARLAGAEVAALDQRFQQAIAQLRKARGARRFGGQYLYQMPWYMFVGAPGSGKTTALVHSGLNFPLSEQFGKGAIRGIGGTRNCDWWFTDEAVLLDTAGRYTTQDAHAATDKAAWQGFLDLLKKHRRRRPINGVIVTISVLDLLRMNEAEREIQAAAVRERIQELHERLGIRFPIYVLVTKCDLLAGFVEFFEDLGKDERAQVWGSTFALAGSGQVDDQLSTYPAEFAALEERLQARMFTRLQQERDVRRRALIQRFPQQFASLRDLLVRYLDDAFRASRYREPALLRGIYFTSGTQEGSPIDRVMASFAAMFGIDRQALAPSVGSGRSYFVTRLLREVLFEESGLAGADPRLERRRRWIQRAVLALAALAFVGLSAALVTSYFRNQAYVQDVTKRIETIRQTAGNLPPSAGVLTLMPLLDEARDLPGGWRDRDRGTPLLSGFGLYQGDKLGSEAQELYQRLLRQTLLPRVVARLEDQLRRGNANNPEYLYEVLRAYLMLGDKRHFKAETVAAVVEYDWKRTLGEISDDQRAAASNHLVALLDHVQDDGGPQPVPELVASARLALQQTPLAKRVYESLKREALLAKIADFSVAANAGKDAALVFARRSAQPLTQGVIGFFTPDGYRALLKGLDPALVEVAQDGWLLGREEAVTTPADAETLKAQILDNYYSEYIKEWDRLLADVGAVAPASLEQEARIAGIMAQPDSPLKRFIVAASQATSLATVSTATLVDTLKDRADGALKKLEQKLASDAPPPAPGAGAAANQNPVDRHFDELHRLVAPAGGGAMPLDQIMATLNEVAVYLDGANSAKREGRPAPSGEVLDKLRRDAAGKPEPVGPILTGVAESGAALTAGSERGRLNALWIANVATFCREAIAGRYPVQRGSSRDITQDDFGRLFAPGGLIDDFFQKNLLQYADISPARWTWRATGNDSLGFSSAALAEFQQAAKIRDAFFSGGKTASIRFDLKPLQLDSNVAHLTLDIDGERFEYSHGPTSPHAFQWPSGKVSGLSRIELEGTDGSRIARSAEGPWDLFKLLEIGRLEPTAQPDRFRVTFNLDGRGGSFELQASSVRNPFGVAALQEFHCPDHL